MCSSCSCKPAHPRRNSTELCGCCAHLVLCLQGWQRLLCCGRGSLHSIRLCLCMRDSSSVAALLDEVIDSFDHASAAGQLTTCSAAGVCSAAR